MFFGVRYNRRYLSKTVVTTLEHGGKWRNTGHLASREEYFREARQWGSIPECPRKCGTGGNSLSPLGFQTSKIVKVIR
jgi:hypothetical protein